MTTKTIPLMRFAKPSAFHEPHYTATFRQNNRYPFFSCAALSIAAFGSMVKQNMMVKKYNGYEIGIWFFKDTVIGQAIVTSIWKRGRR
jgi:hypothetical protein